MIRAAKTLMLDVRVGCHMGEVLFAAGYPHGVAVHTAARVVALAGANEVFVSSTTRELLSSGGFQVEPAGVFELKGLSGTHEVFRVGPGTQ